LIQCFLAQNIEKLADQGFYYPHDEQVALGKNMRISGGNFQRLDDLDALQEAADQRNQSLLFSGERLLIDFSRNDDLFERLAARNYEINILLFIRNPFETFRSGYIQAVKRNGCTSSFEQYCEINKFAPKMVSLVGKLHKGCEKYEVNLTVLNYDTHRLSLIERVATFLGLEAHSMQGVKQRVNRSLNPSEIQVQRKFNQYFGAQSYQFISDVLYEELPHVESTPIMPSRESYTKIVDYLNQSIRETNEILSANCEKYEIIDQK
jgi:hypothetical protein